jgi:hypothetical protein
MFYVIVLYLAVWGVAIIDELLEILRLLDYLLTNNCIILMLYDYEIKSAMCHNYVLSFSTFNISISTLKTVLILILVI